MKITTIYITSQSIFLTQLEKNKSTNVKDYQIDISSTKKEDVAHQLKTFLKEKHIDSDRLVFIIPRHQVTVRYLNLPSVDDKEIKKMVEYESDNLFPYKQEELIVGHTVIEKNTEGYSQVMLVAVKREAVDDELLLFKRAGLIPDAVELSSVCLFNQFTQKQNETENRILINLEDSFLDILLVRAGKLFFSRGLDLKEKEAGRRLVKEVGEIIDTHRTRGINIDKLIISGRQVDLHGFASELESAFSVNVEINQEISVTRGPILSLNADIQKIDLLPKEYKLQRIRAKRKKLAFYFITLLLLNASLVANLVFLRIKERQEYLRFLQSETGKIETEAVALEKKLIRMQIVQGYLDSGRLTLGLLNELYAIAPQGIRLTSLAISGQSPAGSFILSGEADGSDSVLKFANLIKKSSLIRSADVNYIKKRKVQSGQEVVDFEIKSTF